MLKERINFEKIPCKCGCGTLIYKYDLWHNRRRYYVNFHSKKGKKLSEDSRKKMSESKKGFKHSEETKQKISEAQLGEKNHMYGKKIPEEQKRRQAERMKGNKIWIGRKHTEESKEKMSAALKGKLKGKLNPNYGKKLSDKHKKILSEIAKKRKGKLNGFYGKTHDERVRKIIRESQINYRLKPRNKKTKYKYKSIGFDSTYEVKVAKWLDSQNIKYEYEGQNCLFIFNEFTTFVDFYLPELDSYIEVKGFWDKKSLERCKFIQSQISEKQKLYVIDKNNIDNIGLNRTFVDLK